MAAGGKVSLSGNDAHAEGSGSKRWGETGSWRQLLQHLDPDVPEATPRRSSCVSQEVIFSASASLNGNLLLQLELSLINTDWKKYLKSSFYSHLASNRAWRAVGTQYVF